MRLITYKKEGTAQIGIRQNDQIVPINNLDGDFPSSISQLLAEDKLPLLAQKLENYQGERISIEKIDYLPLIPRPGKNCLYWSELCSACSRRWCSSTILSRNIL